MFLTGTNRIAGAAAGAAVGAHKIYPEQQGRGRPDQNEGQTPGVYETGRILGLT